MQKLVKAVVCKDATQAKSYLKSLDSTWKISDRDLLARRNDEIIMFKIYNQSLSPLDWFGCPQLNAVEFLTFDFKEDFEIATKYIASRLRSSYEAY